LLRQVGNPYRIAMALNFTGDLRRCQQNYRAAKEVYEESIALLREINAVRDLASVLQNLGYACLHLGEASQARAMFAESLSLQLAQGNKAGAAECLLGYAALAADGGNYAAAARLLAAAVAIGGERIASAWAATRIEYESTLDAARLGLSEQEYEAEQSAGCMMSLEGAVAYTRSQRLTGNQGLPVAGEITSDFTPPLEGLTRREQEIVELIAHGKSNGEIAGELVVSKRTVEKHIAHILMKLGVTNRSQIVLWGIESGQARLSEDQ
jgi:non-specific serine/threonine protein kinase